MDARLGGSGESLDGLLDGLTANPATFMGVPAATDPSGSGAAFLAATVMAECQALACRKPGFASA